MDAVIELIKETFHPEPFTEIEENIEGTLLHLSRESFGKCKYILLVNNFDAERSLQYLIRRQKAKLKEYYKTSILKGVGVIEIFIGEHSEWEHRTDEVRPDWHGLQSVILQGLLFIDPEKKKYALSRSHWGPFKFGNFQGQVDKVHYLLGKIGAT